MEKRNMKINELLIDPKAPRLELILNRDGKKTNRAILKEDWSCYVVFRGEIFHIKIFAGFEFDGRSVTDYNRYDDDFIRAALVHDWLYKAKPVFIIHRLNKAYEITRFGADNIYAQVLKRHHGATLIERWRDRIGLFFFGGAAWRSHGAEARAIGLTEGFVHDTGVKYE